MASKKQPDKREPEHISQKPFSVVLAEFATASNSLNNPMGSSSAGMSPAMMRDISIKGGHSPRDKQKKTDKPSAGGDVDFGYDTDLSDCTVESVKKEMSKIGGDDDDYRPDFDHLIEGIFEENDDVTLRNNLISLGRKYAVKGLEEDSQSSEVSRAFSGQEQQVHMLLDEYTSATMDVSKEIEAMRAVRSRDRRALSDMMEVRATLLNGKLNAIKHLSSMTKDKFDISIKLKKDRDGADPDGSSMSTQTIQRLFSIGRKNLIADSGVSIPVDDDADDTSFAAETALHQGMETPDAVSDGDKFTEYENEGVEYVLDIGADGEQRQIYAIDRHDNIIPDYPMPTDPSSLHFDINELSGQATDQLQRSYRVRKDGVDIVQRDFDD